MNKQLLSENGFVELENCASNSGTLNLASSIGDVFHLPNMSLVQTLSPKSIQSSTQNTYSGNYGLDDFPLHTDLAHWCLPPRFFILRCIVPDPKVSTQFLSKDIALRGTVWLNSKEGHFKPRRKVGNMQHLLRIVENNIFRWDDTFITAQNDEGKKVAAHFKGLRNSREIVRIRFTKPGQALLVDN